MTASISFEFFPPKTDEGTATLRETYNALATKSPGYFSVTFGAGGSTQEKTAETVRDIIQSGSDAAPHLSCVGQTRESIRALLASYRRMGVKRIVALRGDLPSGMGASTANELRYANELVSFIREESGDEFHLEVAAYPEMHPQASSPSADLSNFKRKVDAGANGAITQYFFNADAYFRFIDQARQSGVEIDITPGIMPITNSTQLIRFSDMCGAEIPRWIRLKLMEFGDDRASIQAFGEDVVTKLCARLIDQGVSSFHFYTMNRAAPSLAICNNLGL